MPVVQGKNGVQLFVYDPNPKGKEAIVMVHGWPLNHTMYEYQYQMLSQYRCVIPDLRGFGKSGAPFTGYSYDDFADDLILTVRQLRLEHFILVGFSMGGAIALHYMKRHKGYGVKKLVLMSAAAPSFTRQPDFPYGLEKSTVTELINQGTGNRPEMLKAFGELFFRPAEGEAFRSWITGIGYGASMSGTIKSLYTLRDADLLDDTRFVKAPTGIFHGRLDRICLYEIGVQLHERIRGSHLYTFEKSGHCIFHDELDKFNHQLYEFIRA